MKKNRKVLALLLAVSMLLGLLAGCGNKNTEDEKSPVGKDGKITIHVPLTDEPSSLDPGYGNSSDSISPRGMMYEGLVRIYDNVLAPGLAEKWEVSADGLTYTFHLRESYWSDGVKVTAADFEYGFKRIVDPSDSAPNGNYQWMGDYIANGAAIRKGELPLDEYGIKAINENTLEIKASSPMPYFVDILKTPCFYPVRQDIAEKYGKSYASSADTVVCCGPFTLTKWDHESELVFEKNDGYWNADAINIDVIDALIISDTETMMNMFDAGQLDMMPNITKEYIEKYVGTGEAIQMDGATIWYCAVNTISDRGAASTLLKNNAFRKALMYAIPRDQLVAAARGDGSFGYTRICPENMSTSYNNKSVGEMFPYTPYPVAGDVDKAKEMFAQALKETGLSANNLPTLTLLTFDDAGAKTCAEVIQNLLKSNFGMEVEIDTQTYSARQEKEHSGDYDLCITNWAPDYNDPMTFLECFTSSNSFNTYFGGMQNSKYDALIAECAVDLDYKDRAEKFFEAEKMVCEELPVIPLFQTSGYWAMKTYLTGITKCGFGANDPDYSRVKYIG